MNATEKLNARLTLGMQILTLVLMVLGFTTYFCLWFMCIV